MKNSDKLSKFFGKDSNQLKNYFCSESIEKGFFGTEKRTIKVGQSIVKITNLYIRKMKNIWEYITDKPMVLYNSKNSPIYHLVFSSNNKTD